ncbi:hypothetical protein Hypma_012390 [Hypsizygus marmoreus]|uniref:MARVEL domain-containing protein n=1 Tax=Hypsizygus marmoreus TaxID=39966 RepID=A0A369JIY0_HYPMA|nr:hypothetical protein Hypma_012390 [Hypsizygus marmoreus]
MATFLPKIRLAAFGTVTLFSFIVLAVAAHLTDISTTYFGGYYSSAALSIATAVLSLLSLPVFLVVDKLRRGAFTSMIAVELSWLTLLWILWLSSAAAATDAASRTFVASCSRYFNSHTRTACKEFSVIQAFGFLNWLILLGYTSTLFAFTLIAANRGQKAVWTQSVKNTDFNAQAVTGTTTAPQFQTDKIQQQQFISPQSSGAPQQQAGHSPVGASQYPPQAGWAGQPQASGPAQSPYPQV